MRELVVLGTASQSPTRRRNHNGYLLRWDGQGILFDPGEGTQRQFSIAGISPASVDRICVTHFHGDHCLGLPGMLLRLSLDQVAHPVHLHYPASGEPHLHHLRHGSIGHDSLDLHTHPVDEPGVVHTDDTMVLSCAPLRHRVPALGWRVEEHPGRRMLPERLAELGIAGPDIGRLQEAGHLDLPDGRRVTVDQVSAHRPGQAFAFIMDTTPCEGARELADGADMVVVECTFMDADAELARATGHLTARQAGELAAEAGVRRLVLTHFSPRYGDDEESDEAFRAEAAEAFGSDDVIAANDLDRIPVPPRQL